MRVGNVAMTAVLAAVLAAACGGPEPGAPVSQPDSGGEVLRAEVIYFDPDGFASKTLGAISERPIDIGAFEGWYRSGSESSDAIEAKPGAHYVVATTVTGCRVPKQAELVREGDNLYARFTGGEEDGGEWEAVGCTREVGPVAQFAVGPDAVRGVRTIGGAAPVDPNGPGKLEALIELGTAPVPDHVKPAELGTASAAELLNVLRQTGSTNTDRATTALSATPQPGRRGFAFVLPGCEQDGALLIVHHSRINAKLTGDQNTRCITAAYFLATFSIDAEQVPPAAVLGGN
jgi:hypothetical protein